jgi:hypothetical protein
VSTGICPSRQGTAADTSDASAPPALTALELGLMGSPYARCHNALIRDVDVSVDVGVDVQEIRV